MTPEEVDALGPLDTEKEYRIVRCTIEMDLVEGEHFNISEMNLTDEEAALSAKYSFITTVQDLFEDLDEYVQTKIVEM